jgi:hypothetical protein
MIWGTVGIGKSEGVVNTSRYIGKDLSKREFVVWHKTNQQEKMQLAVHPEKYCIFVDERASLKDTTDNKGVPALNGHKATIGEDANVSYLEWVKTLIMNIASHPKSMVIFFKDEINLATPSVQSAEYQIILDKAIDDLSFSENTFIIAAGNRQEDRSNVFDMSMALKNRFLHCTLGVPTTQDWGVWAIENKLDARIVSYVTMYKGREALYDMPSEQDKQDAFPTPRTVHMASEMIKGLPDNTKEDIEQIEQYVASCVGDAWANEFKNWLNLNKRVNIQEILDSPDKIKKLPLNLQTTTISGIVGKYQEDDAILLKAVNVAMAVGQEEMSVFMLRMLAKVNVNFFMAKVSASEHYKQITAKFKKYFTE